MKTIKQTSRGFPPTLGDKFLLVSESNGTSATIISEIHDFNKGEDLECTLEVEGFKNLHVKTHRLEALLLSDKEVKKILHSISTEIKSTKTKLPGIRSSIRKEIKKVRELSKLNVSKIIENEINEAILNVKLKVEDLLDIRGSIYQEIKSLNLRYSRVKNSRMVLPMEEIIYPMGSRSKIK